MAWQNPKTNWVAGDIPGAGDFNRSEGNAKYLKEQVDGLKNGSIAAGKATNATNATKAGDALKLGGVVNTAFNVIYEPSNDVILNMPTYDYIHGTTEKLTKRFRIAYEGLYKIIAQIRAGGPIGNVFVTIQTSPSTVVAQFDSIIRDDAWHTYELTFQGEAEREYQMYLKKQGTGGTLYMRNVKLCGRPRTARPAFKIISQATP